MNGDEFYDIWEEDDKPSDPSELLALENARLRGQLESQKSPKIEKFYIVRGNQIFVCHKGQLEMKRVKDENSGEVLRDIKVEGARMVGYGPDGIRKVDR